MPHSRVKGKGLGICRIIDMSGCATFPCKGKDPGICLIIILLIVGRATFSCKREGSGDLPYHRSCLLSGRATFSCKGKGPGDLPYHNLAYCQAVPHSHVKG